MTPDLVVRGDLPEEVACEVTSDLKGSLRMAEVVAQVAEGMHGKCKVLSSIPSTISKPQVTRMAQNSSVSFTQIQQLLTFCNFCFLFYLSSSLCVHKHRHITLERIKK
jgi:hypothetical protein